MVPHGQGTSEFEFEAVGGGVSLCNRLSQSSVEFPLEV